jgi:TolB-like protein/Tfp pilus assembly protein PilF
LQPTNRARSKSFVPPAFSATQPTFDTHRVAVLPFANFSPDAKDEYFADGITEEIISTVSGISGLSVISRTSVMGYKGTTKKVKEIGRELDVGSVLEGSFRKAGNRIRITTQLIDVAGDRHLWAQNYDRELDDVFAVQSDIARQVANALRIRILPRDQAHIEKTPTRNPEAHELYLKGRYDWNQRNKESLLKAIEEYQAAIKLDPDYALAYSGMADCYSVLGDHDYLPYAEAFSKSKEYALKAVERDDRSAEAHTSLATAIYHSRESGAEAEFEKAIELNASYATAHHWYGILLLYAGRREDALQEALTAQKLDPLSPQIATFLGIAYDALGRYDQAERQYFRALELQPDFLPAIANLISTYWHERKFADVERQAEVYLRISKDELLNKVGLAANYALAGKEMEARRTMTEAEAMPDPTHHGDGLRIIYYIALGELETAVELIEGEYARGADWLGEIAYDPLYAAVRNDPRVKSILRKVGAAL